MTRPGVSGNRTRTADATSADDGGVWAWIVIAMAVWVVGALLLALLVGAMIRLADRRAGVVPDTVPANFAVDPAAVGPAHRSPAPRAQRRRLPLSPIGVALVAMGTALMVSGYAVRVSGAGGPYAQLLSMDAPFSLPRMFVATVFAVAALAAFAGAGRHPGRRSWWTGVGVVAALVAVVKGGGTVHVEALRLLEGAVGRAGAFAASALAAVLVVGALALLSRGERRDRNRVLVALCLYGVASVGLSAVSSVVGGAWGGRWAAGATLVEETGEALAGVHFLMAVLVGVAPALVLPRTWLLQRRADAASLDVPDPLAGRPGLPDPAAG